jgi:bifunctional DNA primase/polymerase-like protein/AAA domain-containing protein
MLFFLGARNHCAALVRIDKTTPQRKRTMTTTKKSAQAAKVKKKRTADGMPRSTARRKSPAKVKAPTSKKVPAKKTSQPQPRTKLDIALEALECPAVAGVFPVGQDKLPITAHGYKDATSDVGEVIAMWEEHPDANVAVWLGADFVVFDCDQKDRKDGTKSDGLRELAKELGVTKSDLLSMTFTNQTPSGGFHLIFKTHVPWGQRNGVLPGVDTRGVQGYVLWPGDEFVDPKTGEVKEYTRFYNGVEDFAPLPKRLLKRHSPVQRKREDARSLVEEEDTEENQEAFREYLEAHEDEWDEDGRLAENRRNDTVALIGALGHDFGLSEDVTVDIGTPWYDERVDCDFEIERHMRSGYQSATGLHGSKTKEGARVLFEEQMESVLDAFKSMADSADQQIEKQAERERKKRQDAASNRKDEIRAHFRSGDQLANVPERDWIVPNWIPNEPSCLILLGKFNVGKSTWFADKVCRLLLDLPWNSAVPAEKGVSVAWLCGEDEHGARITLQHSYEEYGGTWPPPPDRFTFVDIVPHLSIKDDGDEMQVWAETIDEVIPGPTRMVVVDTFHRATADVSFSDDEAAKKTWNNALFLAQMLHAPLITTQHPPHNASDDRPAGSFLHQANTDLTISIKKDPHYGANDSARIAAVTRSKIGAEKGRGRTEEFFRMVTDKTGEFNKFGDEIEKVRIEYPADAFPDDPDAPTVDEIKRDYMGTMVLDILLKEPDEEFSVSEMSKRLDGLSYDIDDKPAGNLPKARTLQKDLPKLFKGHPHTCYERNAGFDLIKAEDGNGRVFRLCFLESDD